MEENRVSLFETSGRLSLNRTVRNTYHLVIHETHPSDTGTYSCSMDVGYMKQHVTVLSVKGMIFILHCCLRREQYLVVCLSVCSFVALIISQ